ncbi:hypothetical protein C0Q70_05609 [Pomacea canaliculata]|uniref:Pericentriolar material 1 protein C-terminal domain-containing protein n=1 Tax=Pomacea canaliculata TaxID=400727 RepID=A0A2T7PLN9_POMCA|nr:hypothetical protein C0Q70_05609 [Pomacea canaliculata]
MATGGKFPRLKQSKSETKQRSNWQRSVSSEKDDALSLTSFPNDIRINNWDLSDLRPSASTDSRRRKKSKGNPEREREQSLSVDSPPHGEQKQRTPSSLSRTRNTPTSQRDALEKLKQKLTYSDDQYSTDGEPNNERAISQGRRRVANNTQPKGATASSSSGREARSNRNNNTETGTDSNQIVGRLMQIRDYIKQASAMMESLQKSGDAGNAEDLAKVGRLIANLREQEQGYLGLLHTSLVVRSEGAEGGDGDLTTREGAVRGESDSEVELEVDSNASETSESSSSSSSRPRIEDKLGISDEDKDSDDNSKEEDTALDNTLIAGGSGGASAAQLLAARNVAETLNHLTQELRMLQKKQDELLAKKQEAEIQLQQAQARDNQARAALAAMEAGRLALEEEGAFLDQVEGQLKSNIVGYPESEDDEASNAREMDALTELQRQLSYLRNEFSAERSENRSRRNTEGVAGGGGSSAAGGSAGSLSVIGQQQQLEDKLQDLQQKKATMDHLLQQLQTLRSHRMQVLNNEASTTHQMSAQQPLRLALPSQRQEQVASTATASSPYRLHDGYGLDISSLLSIPMMAAEGSTGPGAANIDLDSIGVDQGSLLSVKEAQEKLQKLQEVRQRLNQLRDLVQYYQKMKTQPGSEEVEKDEGQDAAIGLTDAGEQAERQSSQGGDGSSFGHPSHSAFLQISGARPISGEQSDEDNASSSDSEDQDGDLRAWDCDPEVQEKIRKLMKAKDKLRNLQGLIADIEGMPGGEKDVDEMCKAPRQRTAPSTAPDHQDAGSASVANLSVSEGEMASDIVPPHDRTGTGEGHLQQQMQELARLQEERHRLLALQDQLKSLHEQFHEGERNSESEVRAEEGVRKGPGDQAASSASVVTFASNDELYSKMRDQRIQREELRSKKKELEAIMKKDQNRRQYFRNQDNQSDTVSYSTGTDAFGASASADATMATWGGSTVDNLENITEDEDGQEGAAPANEDDGYPSDGIVQVEEEEEENDDTDNGTYTIDADARQRRQARLLSAPQGLGARPKTSRGHRGFPQPIRPVSRKNIKKSENQSWKHASVEEERAPTRKAKQTFSKNVENSSSVENESTRSPLQQFQKQLERMSAMCQNLMQEQPAVLSNRLQQQNLLQSQLATLSPVAEGNLPAPNDLQSQLMRELQQQQLMMAISQCNQQLMMQQYDMQALQRQLQQLTGQMAGLQQHIPSTLLPAAPDQLVPQPFTTHSQVIATPFSAQLSPLSSTLAAHVPNNVATSVNVQSSRQTTFTVNPSFPGSFHYANSQLPVSQGVQTTSVDGFPSSTDTDKIPSKSSKERRASIEASNGEGYRLSQPFQMWEGAEGGSQPAFQQERNVPRMNLQAFLKSRRKKSSKKSSERIPQNQPEWQVAGTRQLEQDGNYRPGLSAGISGLGFSDKASVSSVASSQMDGAEGGQENQPGHTSTFGELNLFEELRETIYTEVATLISKNESRPQYLINLFRELQNLTTDLMRQRAIFSVQEIVQSSLTRQDLGSPEGWQPWKTVQEPAVSEMTPSESVATSDEEVKPSMRRHSALLEQQQKQKSQEARANCGSLKNSKFDYTEAAVSTSSVSTPTNEVGESPFSRDSLGDTVIHLDKALAKMRLEMQQADRVRGERSRGVVENRPELLSELAGDQGSESSVSDMPYPRIDAQELDQQIKGIMGQVIPVVKEHINDICSPHFLAYVQRLVLSLTRQPGHSQEFSRFFYGQLSSILQDSLAKYEGRRVRECGEDLLLDMSEVLFNELAFLRIMKDLDDPRAVEKIKGKSWFTPSTIKNPQAAMLGEEYTSAGNESDNESSEEDRDHGDAITTQNLNVNGLDEEEDLGKDRDDELAQKLVTQGVDEKDEDTSDVFSSSAFHIQLAMSETKPFTRIGSDEDTDGSDESLSLEDPSDTAVSRNSMMENRREQVSAATPTSSTIANTTSVISPAAAAASSPHQHSLPAATVEKDGDVSEADGTQEMASTADGSRGCDGSSSSTDVGKKHIEDGVVMQVNGDLGSTQEEEVPVDIGDLPPSLNLSNPELVEQKREEENRTTGIEAIMNSMDVGQELAGDGSALKEPESSGAPQEP